MLITLYGFSMAESNTIFHSFLQLLRFYIFSAFTIQSFSENAMPYARTVYFLR